MADQLQLRGGTTTEHSTFTGALKEVTVDTTKKTLVVHDNSTVGGVPLAKEDLSNVPAGTITSAMIADGTIVAGDIADGTITSAKITDGTLVNADINAAAAIDLTKLANGALPNGITVASANITDLSIATADIADGAVTSAKIADGTIVDADVSATAAIALSKLATGALPSAITVNSSNIDDLSIATGDLADGAVTSAKIADGTIVNGDISSLAAIDLGKLAVGALPTGITVASANIVDGTIVNADIAAGAEIAVSKLADGASRQVLQTDAAGTGVEWTDNVDLPGTLDVTGAATFDSTANIAGNLTVDTNTLFVDASNNRVGIGTTSPGSLLQLGGTTNKGIRIDSGTSNPGFAGMFDDEFNISINRDGSNGAIANSGKSCANIQLNGTSGGSYIHFSTAAANNTNPTERARIDSSGRLLVGTSSTSATTTVVIQGRSDDPTNEATLYLQRGSSGSAGLAAPFGDIRFADSSSNLAAGIIGQRDGGTWTSGVSHPGRLVFSTTPDSAASPVERLRITNGGDFYFNTTVSTKTSEGFRIESGGIPTVSRGTNGSFMLFYAASSGNLIGSITNNGGTATAYNTSSDYRLKENVTSVTDGITRLRQLKPSRFNFIADPDTTVDGFIAHEVQTVVPEAITGEKDAVDDEGNPIYQGIDQSKLVPLLTAALQEAVAKIESLEARLTAAGI